jgi:phosphotransferase system  glucose/maltose/N-acetylglucosamine-specific IIC component
MLGFITYLPWTDPRDPIYLTVVNLLLGIIVVALVFYLLVVMFLDFKQRRKEHKQKLETKTDLKDILSRLGVTMRDGGEKLRKDDDAPKKQG